MKFGRHIPERTFFAAFVFSVLFLFVFSRNAYAYLDMGTGSYIIQVAIASMLGVLVTVRIYWKKIKAYVAKLFSGGKDAGENEK